MRPFQHFNAKTLDDAVLAAREKSKIIAGGTDCLSILKNRALPTYPETLANIKTIPGLEYIKEDAGGLKVGALTRLCDIEDSPIVKDRYSMLADAAKSVGSPRAELELGMSAESGLLQLMKSQSHEFIFHHQDGTLAFP